LGGKLTLVSAPAGFGKTTLLSTWLDASSSRAAVWLSLDVADNDPARFWRYFITAVDQLQPGSGETALVLLNSPQAPPMEAILTTLLNEVADLNADAVLILDDYHSVESHAVHEALTFLIEHLPSRIHLIISTRADPPLPLARLRARGEMTELRAADLRFTPEEAAAFLNQVMDLKLAAEDMADLETRTEGWVAGLQMAALAMHGHADVSAFIAAFTGSNRHVVDYLSEEVLGRQAEAVRTFLFETSILDRMCGALCDAVTYKDNSQEILEYLEHANLFVIPLDEERRWYRYHHLFTDVLRQQLRETDAELLPELHRRASVWFERQNLAVEAVHHALESHDFERAATLIEDIGLSVMLPGQGHTLLGWLDRLPDALVRSRPALCIVHAGALMFANESEAAEARLDDAESGLRPDTPADQANIILGRVAAVRGNLARISGDLASCVTLSRRALDLLPETEFMWVVARLNAAYEYLVSGDVTPTTERLVAEVIAPVRATGNPLTILRCIINLARLELLQGCLRQAAATFEEAARVSSGPAGREVLVGNPAYYFGMSDLLREWNDLDGAQRHLEQGMNLVTGMPTVDADVVVHGFITLARLHQARGEYGAAIATLEDLLHLAYQRTFFAPLVARGVAAKARVQIAQGDLASAIDWMEENGLCAQDEPGYLHEDEYLTLARVLVAQGRRNPIGLYLDDALHLLDRLLRSAEVGERTRSVIEILDLQALAMHAWSEAGGAFAVLERALTLAEPEGYVRVFVDEGVPMKAVLSGLLKVRRKADRGTQHLPSLGYIRRLLAALESPHTSTESFAPGGYAPGQDQAPLDPLTAREREVLALIAEGLSNQEISAHLFIATSTAKSYVHSILRKLEVENRTKAITRARELHLV